MRRLTFLKLAGIVYLVFTAYTLIDMMVRIYFNRPSKKMKSLNGFKQIHATTKINPGSKVTHLVEVWGKAAIGLYLWQHIFEATLEDVNGKFLRYGELEMENLKFRFHTGPLVTPQTVGDDTQNAILVINGREPKKVDFALNWLKTLTKLKRVNNLAVVLLGNEQCHNEWLMPYMARNGGIIKLAFVVYDISYVNNADFHQWPLGVATYRDFPIVHIANGLITKRRKYICNFLGTVYGNSSRTTLMNILQADENLKKDCFVHSRYQWLPSETKETSEMYRYAMRNSDLTLCPVGKNTECYRIYEALSYGSVPVIEDVMTPGVCGRSSTDDGLQVPLRVLKKMHAPVIYLKSWDELKNIIDQERELSLEYKMKRRKKLLVWYQKFKYNLRNEFIKMVKHGFELV